MKTYILKTWKVITGYKHNEFRSYADAYDYAQWWIMDQGASGIEIIESFCECPMIGETIYVPEYIN